MGVGARAPAWPHPRLPVRRSLSHRLTARPPGRKARPPVRTYGDAGACVPPCTCIARSGVAAGWVHGRVARAHSAPPGGLFMCPCWLGKACTRSTVLRAPKSSRSPSPSPSPARGTPLQVQFLPMHVRPCHVQYFFSGIRGSSLGSRVVECHSLHFAGRSSVLNLGTTSKSRKEGVLRSENHA